MTEVIIRDEGGIRSIEASGHAAGSERVCAAVSVLMQSFAGFLKLQKETEDYTCIVDKKNAHCLAAVYGGGDFIEGAFFCTVTGLRALAEQYPEYVSCKIFDFSAGTGAKSEEETDTLNIPQGNAAMHGGDTPAKEESICAKSMSCLRSL